MMSNQAETALSGVALFDAQYVYSAILSKIARRDIVYIHVYTLMMSNQAETALSGVALFDAQYVYTCIYI